MNYRILSKFYRRWGLLVHVSNYVWSHEWLDVALVESIEVIVSKDNDVLNYRIMNESYRHPMFLRKKMKVWMIDFYANPCDFMDCCHPFWIIVYWNEISGVARVESIAGFASIRVEQGTDWPSPGRSALWPAGLFATPVAPFRSKFARLCHWV